MTWDRWAILIVLGLFIVVLLRATNLLGNNPYLREREAERLSGPFPSDMTSEDKQRYLDMFGVSGRSAKQSLLYISLAAIAALLIYFMG